MITVILVKRFLTLANHQNLAEICQARRKTIVQLLFCKFDLGTRSGYGFVLDR